jgi:uncharacterized protein
MKPWREVVAPHPDVLAGTFKQSEFAADITAVHTGKATPEYQDAAAFYQRTFITEGMGLLLTSVARRLNGQGGDPVIQLQTAFGGGKTHTMLAVYHLATRQCSLKELAGIPHLLDQAGLLDVPKARVVVLDGTARAPGQASKQGKVVINTLWGELGWQLGGAQGYEMVKEADKTGTSPGKSVLKALLEDYAPCVILVDELVAYIRQFSDTQALSGGTYDSNLSFVQAMTEAIKLVPKAIMLASLPESEVEAGSNRGVGALQALEKTFGRVQALWKPVAAEEAFEIVRRRLFEPVRDVKTRDAVCRAFADAYLAEGSKLPSETQEARYFDRLIKAYPIHPEVFDRLYEDWTTLQSFQRTRGILKLMAHVIYRLWKDQNPDLMIMPGSLPLYDSNTRNELTYYLAAGWDAVLDKDIDGERAETTEMETKEPRFGAIHAACRVARTLFLGSAPSAAGTQKGIRGLDRARVLLGCLQAGQASSTYVDALNRLVDRLHYLNSSGDKTQDTTRFWFDTRANLRREMEDRKGRFGDKSVEVRDKLAGMLQKLSPAGSLFDGAHIFTPHADVADDNALRLVFLAPDKFYSKQDGRLATEEVLEFVRNNGPRPRYRGNRLLFVAADHASLSRAVDCVRTVLAWNSIVEDVTAMRLNIDALQAQQARKELESAKLVLPRVARECYKWLLCPVLATPQDRIPTVEAHPLNTSGAEFGAEIARVCRENELVITEWSPVHLRTELTKLYWKDGKEAVGAVAFWEDTQKYLYLPRLKSREVLEKAILSGASSKDFFGTAYNQKDDQFEGFKFGDKDIQIDKTLLLIAPAAAATYQASQSAPPPPMNPPPNPPEPQAGENHGGGTPPPDPRTDPGNSGGTRPEPPGKTPPGPKTFSGSVEVSATAAKVKLISIVDEIVALLIADPLAKVKLTLQIDAEFPSGASVHTKRTVSENATSLNFKSKDWE